jgi:hypothetical protein
VADNAHIAYPVSCVGFHGFTSGEIGKWKSENRKWLNCRGGRAAIPFSDFPFPISGLLSEQAFREGTVRTTNFVL